jgi:SAM-dependent methyltransferase
MSELDYVDRNRATWEGLAPQYAAAGRRSWESEPSWGIWGVPETQVHLLPDVAGKDTLELGCGTGYVSAWLARRGARAVGIDPTDAQLATARQLEQEFGLGVGLVSAVAEQLPFADHSFDLVISEYGASIWSDPYRWVPEAVRVLRPGGELIFLVNSNLLMLCVPDYEGELATPALRRPYFGMHRFEWPDDDSVEFHLGHGDWIRLLRDNGLEVTDLLELQPPAQATSDADFVSLEWARQWPTEEVWKARLRA